MQCWTLSLISLALATTLALAWSILLTPGSYFPIRHLYIQNSTDSAATLNPLKATIPETMRNTTIAVRTSTGLKMKSDVVAPGESEAWEEQHGSASCGNGDGLDDLVGDGLMLVLSAIVERDRWSLRKVILSYSFFFSNFLGERIEWDMINLEGKRDEELIIEERNDTCERDEGFAMWWWYVWMGILDGLRGPKHEGCKPCSCYYPLLLGRS